MTSSHTEHAPGRALASTKNCRLHSNLHSNQPRSRPPLSLKTSLYLTVHSSKLSVEQIADALGISPSYLYRAVLEGESGVRFPVDLVPRLMEVTGDFRTLDFLAANSGQLLVSIPRARALKRKSVARIILETERQFNSLLEKILDYLADPKAASIRELKAELRRHLSEIRALALALESWSQRELDL
jgi:hypothetical protein